MSQANTTFSEENNVDMDFDSEQVQEEQHMDSSEKSTKPETIATIDVNLNWSEVSKLDWNQEAIYDHLHCCLCGTELNFSHKANYMQMTVSEEASCPHCKIKTRESFHSVQ